MNPRSPNTCDAIRVHVTTGALEVYASVVDPSWDSAERIAPSPGKMMSLASHLPPELVSRVLLVVLSTVISVGCAEVVFRWYTERTFDREFRHGPGPGHGPRSAGLRLQAPCVRGVSRKRGQEADVSLSHQRAWPARSRPACQGAGHEARARHGRLLHLGICRRGGGSVSTGRRTPARGTRPAGHRSHQRRDSGLQQPAGAATAGAVDADLPAGRSLSRLRRQRRRTVNGDPRPQRRSTGTRARGSSPRWPNG